MAVGVKLILPGKPAKATSVMAGVTRGMSDVTAMLLQHLLNITTFEGFDRPAPGVSEAGGSRFCYVIRNCAAEQNVMRLDVRPGSKYHRSLQYIQQFADVTGPCIHFQLS